MTGRASTTLTAQCTLHIHNAQCTVQSALHREVAGGGLSMKMEETVAS